MGNERVTLKVLNSCGCLTDVSSKKPICLCSSEELVKTLGRRYALAILNIVGNRPNVRFQELKDRLGKVSSSTLAIRLAKMGQMGLLRRTAYPEIPPRVEYSLTPVGQMLREKLNTIHVRIRAR